MSNPQIEESQLSSFLWMTLGIGVTFVGLAMLARDTVKEKLKDIIGAIDFDIYD